MLANQWRRVRWRACSGVNRLDQASMTSMMKSSRYTAPNRPSAAGMSQSTHMGGYLSKVAAILVVLCAPNPLLWAQAGGVIPAPRQTFLDNSGNVVASGSLYHYTCGTTTDLNVYSDSALSSALPQPITLNSAGRPQTGGSVETAVYLTAVCHKFVLKDSTGATIWTQDNIYPQNYLGSGTLGNSYFLRGDATSGYTWARPVTVITTTSTGTQDDFAPGLVGDTLLRCNNAALLTIRGLAGGYDGQRLWIVSMGAGQVDLAHQNANSSAANRLLNMATSASSSLAAGSGSALYIYDASTLRWRLVAHEQGAPITPTYAAGDYTTTGAGGWSVGSGDVTTFHYKLSGRMLTVAFTIDTSSVIAAVGGILRIKVPGSFTANKATYTAIGFLGDNAATATAGFVRVLASGTVLEIQRNDTANFTASTDATYVRGELTFEVQ